MSWFNMWDGLKNKTCRYLLQHYLGQFLEEKLNLEQLNVELYNGRATVKNVSLNVETLNELFEAQGWSVEVIGGRIGLITVTVPWNALMTNDSSVEISDLFICLRPVKRQNDGTSMLESMWSSVSSSIQLAHECMKQTDNDCSREPGAQHEGIDGLEKFAETIDSVLNRVKAKCTNVVLRVEYQSEVSMHGIAVVLKINSLSYQNETENYKKPETQTNEDGLGRRESVPHENTHRLPTFTTHNISLSDIHIYTEEFNVPCNSDERGDTKPQAGVLESGVFYSITSVLPDSTAVQNKDIEAQHSSNRRGSDEIINCTEKEGEVVPIPIIQLKGQQKILLKMKQSEDVSGPKVMLDIELGPLCLISSPRQLHAISQFLDLFSEDINTAGSASNMPNQQTTVQSSNATHRNYRTNMTGNLGNQNMWSETCEDELVTLNENITEKIGNKYDYVYRYCESISSSMSSSSNVTSSSRFQRKVANMDICGDVSKFNIRIATILAIILQEDILVENSLILCNSPLNEKSQYDMKELAEQCFEAFNNTWNDQHITNKRINKLCDKNHILIQLSPVIAEGMQHRNRHILLSKMSITATKFDLYEVLEEMTTPLIDFNREDTSFKGFRQRPELSINIKSTSPFNVRRPGDLHSNPVTTIDIIIEKCVIELDISIYDRLSAIIADSPFKKRSLRNYHCKRIRKSSASNREIKISCEKSEVKIRFPIVDMRPIHDPERIPWWKQNIRPDFLLLTLKEMRVTTELTSTEITANEINAFYCEDEKTKIHLLKVTTACDSTSKNPVYEYPKINIKTTEECDILSEGCGSSNVKSSNFSHNLPFSAKRVCRQSDTAHTKHDASEELETFLLPGETSEIRNFCDTAIKSSRLHIKVNIPAAALQLESKQLYETIYNRLNSSLFIWQPCSSLYKNTVKFRSEPQMMKQSFLNVGLFDSLYVPSNRTPDTENAAENCEEKDKYSLVSKKSSDLSSSVESVDDDEAKCDNDMYLSDNDASIYVSAQQNINETCSLTNTKQSSDGNDCSFEISVGKAELTLMVPTRDIEKRVLPGQLGKFIAKLKELSIIFVNGHNSNKNLAYLCLDLKNLEVYHCGLIPMGSPNSINMNSEIPKYMQSTFYQTPQCLTKGKVVGCKEREILSMVMEIRKIPEQNIKRLKITTGLQKTTLRHYPTIPPHTWINQLIDFLDVTDYPVSGYEPFGVITEMQLHFWDCAIDYRPKNLPYRSVVEIGSFNVSSNIISSITGCTLRFVVEECVLSIAPFDNIKGAYPDNQISSLPSSDLVPTLDIGLLDISLRLSERSTEKCPKLDFRCSIKDVHLRTCSDSGSALAHLIAYLANDGDIPKSNDDRSPSHSAFSSVYSHADLLEVGDRKFSSATEISIEQQERVNKLMAEAVRESKTSSTTRDYVSEEKAGERGIEVFYFPDESNQTSNNQRAQSFDSEQIQNEANTSSPAQESDFNELGELITFETNVISKSYAILNDDSTEALPQIKEDLGDITAKDIQILEDDTSPSTYDDDYCLLAEEEKCYMSNFGIKNIKLSDDPLRIVDNHFCLPTGRPDLLKPPENFPMAVLRYTLCEMSFTWHLYGGNDFPLNEVAANQSGFKASNDSSKEKNTTNMSEAYKYGVSYSRSTESIQYGRKPKEKLTWRTRGGSNRNHEVLVEIQFSKASFSHEVYPSHTIQASRQVLIVNEIEIRDRLQTSEINKFLYHPKLSNLPNKSNQNMIVIKALQVRPDPKVKQSQECSLRISLLPLRLHIDQDTLLFMVEFFTNLSERCNNETAEESSAVQQNRLTQEPVMMVDDIPEAMQDLHARRLVSTNLNLLMEDNKQNQLELPPADACNSGLEESAPIYFREVVFSPEVLIRFDYHGRRVELSRGPVAGLLMGLGQLQCSQIKLKKIIYKRGLLGVEKLITYLCKEWLRDIKKNQLPNILSGVGPTYAFIQLFQGIYDLFWLPIEQFQKDGRIIRGLQLGAQSFTARTALAALEITSRIIQLLQFTAETAFDMVSPGPTVRRSRNIRRGKKKRTHRPKDIREGVTNAYIIVKEGFNDSAQTLIETAVTEHDQKGYTGAVGAVMRQIPQLVVCPAVLATQATTNILGGVKSSLVPEAQLEARDKWKDDTD